MVEDNPGDVRLIHEAFREAALPVEVKVVEDGERALALLRRQPPYNQGWLPDLILLDLNLPKVDGHQVLEEVKADPNLRRIPVLILSSSRSKDDVVKSYNSHANCYIPKPMVFEDFVRIVKGIEDFWLKAVTLPEMSRHQTASF